MTSPEAALAACRFLHDVSAMLLWGAFAYLVTLVPGDLAGEVGRRLHGFRLAAIGVAVLTTAAALPVEAAMIGSGWSAALDAGTVRTVLLQTSVGQAWQVQAAAALLLLATLLAPPGARQAATAIASGLLVASLALTGHAVMQEGWPGIAHRANDALHVLSGGAWLGALLPLALILRVLGDLERGVGAGAALRRFSTAGHVAVALVVASGIVNTMLVLGRWPTDLSSPYQAMLLAKVLLVGMMIGLAVVNRYRFVPRLARQGADAARAIRVGTAFELALGLAVVGLVSVFGMLTPV